MHAYTFSLYGIYLCPWRILGKKCQNKRSEFYFYFNQKIERYNILTNNWEIFDMKLYHGFEGYNLIPTTRPNEFTIFGGIKGSKSNNQVYTYDLLNKTVINNKTVVNPVLLGKHLMLNANETLLITGGEENAYQWEKYSYIKESPMCAGTGVFSDKYLGQMKSFNYNQSSLNIQYNPNTQMNYLTRDYSQKSIIFGTDNEPFQLEVDNFTGSVDILSVPASLLLKNYQSVCRVNQNLLFFAGGINENLNNITKKAFIYNLNARAVIPAGDMNQIRYTFPIIFCNGYVYCIGGRSFGNDKKSIMNKVERCNLESLKWEELPDLNVKRCTSNVFCINGRIFVAGGYTDQSKRTNTIEMFNESNFKWEILDCKLNVPIEACSVLVVNQKVYLFGGKTDKKKSTQKIFLDFENYPTVICEKMDQEMNYPDSLSKLVTVRGYTFIFGSDITSKMDIFNPNNMGNANYDELASPFM